MTSRLAEAAFRTLPSEAAVLDHAGTIVLVNDAWDRFSRDNGGDDRCGTGVNYLRVCDRSAASGDSIAGIAASAVRAVLDGNAPAAALDYPCHSPTTERWFHLRAQVVDGAHHVLVLHEEISSHVAERAALEYAATHDSLTGLANRALLHSRLSTSNALRDRRRNDDVSIVVLDLDNFKHVIDTYGHPVGDAVLATIGQRLQHLGRVSDTVARWGGDEFVLLLPGCGREAAESLRADALAAVAEPVQLGIIDLRIKASTGLAVGHLGDDLTELLKVADEGAYREKAHRRP